MKKRHKITTQLIEVFLIAIVISFGMFLGLIYNQLSNISQSIVQSQLENLVDSYQKEWSNGEMIEPNVDSDTYFIQGMITESITDGKPCGSLTVINYSDNIGDQIGSQTSIDKFVEMLEIKPTVAHQVNQNIKVINGEKMICEYATSQMNENSYYFVLFMTPMSTTNATRKVIMLKMLASFSVALAISVLILIAWSTNHVKRIQFLERHISNLPKTNYTEEYLDKGNDELNSLSESIEKMRKEILNNESTKQEILQNVSHDIKTPIGVIKSYAEAMQDGLFLDKGPSVIVNQADILYTKTKQLITYNKLSYLSNDKEFEDVNMKRVIESVVSNLLVKRSDIEFKLDLENVIFKGYSDNYVVVIENIVENAIRYAKKLISITLKEDYIKIYNDGEPIEDKFINEGFKAYEKGSKGQFGLGMSIVCKTLDFFNFSLKAINEDDGVSFIIEKKDIKKIQ